MKKNIRQIFSIWNIVFILAIGWLLYQKIPLWIDQYKFQDQQAPKVTVFALDGKETFLPIINKKQVLVFWATWCGPCSIELARLNKLVENGTVNKSDIAAVSIMENAKVVKDTVLERGYQFDVFLDFDGSAANQFKVEGTPTLAFVDNLGNITWMTTGLSPSLEFRVKRFFGK